MDSYYQDMLSVMKDHLKKRFSNSSCRKHCIDEEGIEVLVSELDEIMKVYGVDWKLEEKLEEEEGINWREEEIV